MRFIASGLAKNYYCLLWFCLFSIIDSKAQVSENDSLLHVYKTAIHDSTKINALHSLAIFYYETHADSTLYYAKAALLIAEKNKDLPGQARSLQIMGVAFDYKGNLDSCLHYLGESLKIYESLKLPEKQAHVISDIGVAWYYSGNYELAIRNQLKALEFRKQVGNKKYISNSMNNIGVAYRAKKDYTAAINFFRQSLALKEEAGDNQGILNTTMNIGSLYQSRQVYDSAFYFAEKGLQIAKKLNAKKDIASCLANMGDALLNMNRVPEAEKLLKQAEEMAIPLNHTQCLITVYHGMGNIRTKQGNLQEAIYYYQKGLDLSAANGRKELMLNFTDKLAETYKALRSYDKALRFRDSSTAISGGLLNAENLRQINEMTAVYQFNEKEKLIILLNAEKNVAASMAGRRKKERNYFIVAAIGFLGIAGFAYKAYAANRKKKEELNRKNIVIQKSLAEKEVLMKEIHHRVKNNLQVVSSLLSLQSNYIKDEQALDAVNESRNRVQSMALIHQNLYQEDNLTGIDVQDYISKLSDNLFASYNIRPGEIKLLKEIEQLNLDVDIVVPIGLILNELISNSLKYAFPGNTSDKMIKVVLKDINGTLLLAVYDNGKGLPVNISAAGNDSFGFKMIDAFLKKLNGTIRRYNEDGARTEIEIPDYKKEII
ncbi:MAG: tetratricopeptide repeat protein [Ferruginibacter sp.]